jgi:hypothetical protein
MEGETMKLGLLMEAAHAQQALGQAALEKLRAHMQGLDEMVREEIRRTLTDQLQVLGNDARRAAEALRSLRRTANLRTALWTMGVTALCSCMSLCEVWWVTPSQAEIAALRTKRDELASTVAKLNQQGGRVDLRRCGDGSRLCVRIDRKAPAYGETADYFVVKGY